MRYNQQRGLVLSTRLVLPAMKFGFQPIQSRYKGLYPQGDWNLSPALDGGETGALGGVGVAAYQSNDSGRTIWRSLLVSATLVLVLGTVLSGFTVGILFVPASMLALAATIFTFLGQSARTA
jgi:hypothetical protein